MSVPPLSDGALAAAISPGKDFDGAVQRVKRAEELGYESVWVNQLPNTRDAGVILSVYAQNTSRIGLGTSVLPIYTRHPTAMAQLAASLDEISSGRFRLGIGLSHQITVEGFWGLKLEKPVLAMREYTEIVRTTLREGGSDFSGELFTARWQYSGPRSPDQQILIAALGPRMLEQAGEIADGVALWMCAPSYIENEVVPRVRKGREKVGKSMDDFVILASLAICLTDDVPAALDAFRSTATVYSNLPFYRRALEGAGYAEDLAGGEPTDRMLLDLAGIGDEAAVRAAIKRYRDAGANLPMIGPFNAPGSAGVDAGFEAAIAT
ncbi:MAG TPA: LLM class flavin-dependent oxidoreductase [Candidatus Dormibacteraeota bacterium]